ncbi:hypothetical protein LSTR_LSTR006556 [Laodelphax striatellus]|uniref:FAD-binding PCMH-type domain-containing protein n=1 Tax=Laodelphax striatellus TaxID=195883 RepID=A0A482WHA4_LAOST|nr:hypothetical protein LSTR_LSTR006556 [Laodelphax striatellus]
MIPGGSWSRETGATSQASDIVQLAENEVIFNLNGKKFKASRFPPETMLITFIRDYAHLKGTKYMCEEGGCGACIVAATVPNPQTGKTTTLAVNSCLTPIYNCHGWAIETIEALGNSSKGYGKIQARLAQNNGAQCGYCSPGMVMNMNCLLQENKEVTMQEVENSFGGNICRCTGYRPIMETFKSFAKDASQDLVKKCVDIEELTVICPRTKEECFTSCGDVCDRAMSPSLNKSRIQLTTVDGKTWNRVNTVRQIFQILEMTVDESYMLVGGNTARGVYRPDKKNNIKHFIDIKGVWELTTCTFSDNSLSLGANSTLTNTMHFLKAVSKSHSNHFAYAEQMANHIDLIASVPIRNIGTLAGNLSIKYQHRNFPSDIFLLLETTGAQLIIEDSFGMEYTLTVEQFLYTDMNKKVIKRISLPALDSSVFHFRSYKITPRAQNAHAYVNAGFLLKLNKNDKLRVLDKPRIVFGGINPHQVHAEATETFLQGKRLLDPRVLKEALKILTSELKPNHVLPDASPEFRKGLAVSLFYKCVLSLLPDEVSSKVRSGGDNLIRPLSTASQTFNTDKTLWPLNQPVAKLEALASCSGEAQYVNDIPTLPGELHAAVVTAKRAVAGSFTLKTEKALKIDGVVACFTAKDIPGRNDCMSSTIMPILTGEEVLATGRILHAGQALCVMVAKTRQLAIEAAEEVEVEYHDVVQPVVDFVAIVKSQDQSRLQLIRKIERKSKGKTNFDMTLSLDTRNKALLHTTIAGASSVTKHTKFFTEIFSNSFLNTVLKIYQFHINVKVRRIGGAYGCKIFPNNKISALCALCAYLLQKPVRLSLDIQTNMQMVGKRLPCYIEYEAGVNVDGKIQYLDAKLYQDVGATSNGKVIIDGTLNFMEYPYNINTWTIGAYSVRTDTTPNTFCRGPGATEASASLEHIMEHIANVVRKDALAVRIQNFRPESQPLLPMIDEIKLSSNYQQSLAEVEAFNRSNRWKKQGISIIPLCYPLQYDGRFHCNVSIYAGDGTISISHGGVECGQGINTKVAQVCAHFLGVPLDFVKVKPTLSLISPNNSASGGSYTSESVSYAVKKCCEEFNKRLQPFKEKMPTANWKTIVQAANTADVDLNCSFMFKKKEYVSNYLCYGVTVLRVEVDILTGQHMILRVDLIQDAGRSMNPTLDVGQIEGAIVMGLGYHLCEELIFDKETGKLLTDRTWNYKTPGAKDIPANFNITLKGNSETPHGALRSKATGEPPLLMSFAVVTAIRCALKSARENCGKHEDWFDLKMPLTCENIWLLGSTSVEDMTL